MTRGERAAMALDKYRMHIRFARAHLSFAGDDRRAGDRKAALYSLDNAAFHREEATEWLKRYKRAHNKMIAAEASL